MTSGRVMIKPVRQGEPGVWFELLGDDEVAGGVGGWEDVPRPRRRTAVEWLGTPGMTLALPLLVQATPGSVPNWNDDWRDRIPGRRPTPKPPASCEANVRRLISWGLPTKRTDQPPVLLVRGPVRAPETTRWVIVDIEWGAQKRNAAGRRTEQEVVVRLKEYIEAAVVKGPAAKSRDRRKKKHKK